MGETGEDGLQLHEDQEPYRPVARWSAIRSTGRGGPRFCPYVGIVRNRQSRLIRGLAR
jgi:hypothetical protein